MQNNKRIFTVLDKNALDFYRENGFACFSSVADRNTLLKIQREWATLVDKYAEEIGVGADLYLREISQWRDLWKEHALFYDLLASRLAALAAWGLELPGSRLLHDHFIRKNADGSNGEIPWHQDSMYWPVDRTGCSTWLAVDDVGVDSGCLEVVAGSHLGAASQPLDFMASGVHFDQDRITALPVQAGDVVLMNSKTWHTSQPISAGVRLAHIALWVPPQTCYVPENASWHPLNDQVTVAAGELLNEDEFPLFGSFSKGFGSSESNAHGGVEVVQGMFNARSCIEQYVQEKAGQNKSLGQLLAKPELREQLVREHCNQNGNSEYASCLRVVERVWISASAYEMHRSRNVFNSAYQSWHACFGPENNKHEGK